MLLFTIGITLFFFSRHYCCFSRYIFDAAEMIFTIFSRRRHREPRVFADSLHANIAAAFLYFAAGFFTLYYAALSIIWLIDSCWRHASIERRRRSIFHATTTSLLKLSFHLDIWPRRRTDSHTRYYVTLTYSHSEMFSRAFRQRWFLFDIDWYFLSPPFHFHFLFYGAAAYAFRWHADMPWYFSTLFIYAE